MALVSSSHDDYRTKSRTRRRALPFAGASGYFKTWTRNTVAIPPFTTTSVVRNLWKPNAFQGTEATQSEYHSGWRRRLGARQDIGGNFRNDKTYVRETKIPLYTMSNEKMTSPGIYIGYTYIGPVTPVAFSSGYSFPPSAASTDSVLNAVGAKVISSVKPTNAVAELSTSLLEIYREGLPRAISSSRWEPQLKDLLNVGSEELLNIHFGWKPLVNDIMGFAHGVLDSHELLSQFNRDSGRVVRRRMDLPPTTSQSYSIVASDVSPYTTSSHGDMYDPATVNKGKVTRTRTTSVRRWFSGAFTYSSNIDGVTADVGVTNVSQYANTLLGADITPTTLYNLAPWSWAADWISSLGDIISFADDHQKYGLVMPYGYLMEHSIVTDTYVFTGPTGFRNSSIVPTPFALVTETKIRRKANPYGFGLTWESLNSTQQAILASLGITKRGH